MSSTEVVNGTEFVEESTELETVVEVDPSTMIPYLEQIAFDLRVILLFTVLTFAMSCTRSWRKIITGGFK